MLFNDRIVIVTGGGRGIGRCISRTFAREGAKVVIADIDIEAGRENEQYIVKSGHTAYFFETDVAVEDNVKRMVNAAVEKYGIVNILINNAGTGCPDCMSEIGMDAWDRVIAVNLRGTFMCSKYCAPEMTRAGGGSIVNIASTRAFMSEPGTEAYSASKGGIVALTHSLAVSMGKNRIRVNSISPGWIDVSGWQKSSGAEPAVLSETDHAQHPAGRVGTPEDIACACLYLCSDSAGFITGTNLTVDGGMTVKMIYV